MYKTIRAAIFTMALLPVLLVSSHAQEDSAPIKTGSPAPAFTTTTLEGKPLTLKGLHGKVVLLDIWATWCGPCREAAPMLQSLHKKYSGQGLKVIGLSVDDDSTSGRVKPYRQENKLTYTMSAAPKSNIPIAIAYHAQGIPLMYLIDQQGVVRWSQAGFNAESGEEKHLSTQIAQLLAKSAKPSKPATQVKTVKTDRSHGS